MQILLNKNIEVADMSTTPDWFKAYTKEQQEQYFEDHPNSKLTLDYKKKTEEEKPEKQIKKLKTKEITDGKDLIKQKGSPTDFTGPANKESSPTGNIKAERYVAALLNKLADLTEKAISEGKDEPDYDLCDIQIPGTNLFCEVNLGVPRKEMPQLKGKPSPNSWADENLAKDRKGEVDAEDAFKKMLEVKNIKIDSKTVPANSLKATQNQLVGSKVAGMTRALESDPHDKNITAPIFISRDGYVLDGHHRWAAQVGLGIKAGIKEPIMMDAQVIDMDMEDLLNLTNEFCDKIGIKPKAGKTAEHSSVLPSAEWALAVYKEEMPIEYKTAIRPILASIQNGEDYKQKGNKIINSLDTFSNWEKFVIADVVDGLSQLQSNLFERLN